MAANVALSDTFDVWRTRTNQVVEYTQTDGGTDAWTVNNSTTSTSPSTGALIVKGGAGFANSVYMQDTLNVFGNVVANTNVTINGSTTLGSDASDNITINGDINTDFRPNADATHKLGNNTFRWSELNVSGYVGSNSTASMLLPSGTTAQRDGDEGTIRYNTDLNRLEVNTGTVFESAGGSKLMDIDIDTFIEVENSSDEDVIHMHTAGTERLNITGANIAIGQAATAGDALLKVAGTMNVDGVSTFNQIATFNSNTVFAANVTVQGDMVVTGTTTTVDSTTVTLNDKTIVLGTTGTVQQDKSYDTSTPIKITNASHGLSNGDIVFLTEIATGAFTNSGGAVTAESTHAITTINSSVFTLDDTTGDTAGLISYTGAQTDSVVDDGGIVLPGNTVHKFTWDNSNDLWNVTDGIYIAGTTKLNAGGSNTANRILKCTNNDGTATWVDFGIFDSSGTRLGP